MKLLVVGRGIAGSSFARHATAKGHDVVVTAPRMGPSTASLAAVGVVRPDWFHGKAKVDVEWGLAWYAANGWLRGSTTAWSTWRHPGFRVRDGFFTVDPLGPLVSVAAGFDLRGDLWDDQANPHARFDATVLCRGANSELPWRRSHGATTEWYESDVDLGGFQGGLSAYENRPRNAMFAFKHPVTNVLRFGSSVASDAAAAINNQVDAEAVAHSAGLVPPSDTARRRTGGIRLMPPTGTEPGPIRRLSASVWACEGFGRVGYSLAPARTYELLLTIERELS